MGAALQGRIPAGTCLGLKGILWEGLQVSATVCASSAVKGDKRGRWRRRSRLVWERRGVCPLEGAGWIWEGLKRVGRLGGAVDVGAAGLSTFALCAQGLLSCPCLIHTRTRTDTQTYVCARTHSRTHTHTHTQTGLDLPPEL